MVSQQTKSPRQPYWPYWSESRQMLNQVYSNHRLTDRPTERLRRTCRWSNHTDSDAFIASAATFYLLCRLTFSYHYAFHQAFPLSLADSSLQHFCRWLKFLQNPGSNIPLHFFLRCGCLPDSHRSRVELGGSRRKWEYCGWLPERSSQPQNKTFAIEEASNRFLHLAAIQEWCPNDTKPSKSTAKWQARRNRPWRSRDSVGSDEPNRPY